MNNKLTVEQNERLNELENLFNIFLDKINNLRENGENEMIDVSSLFDDLSDSIKELN